MSETENETYPLPPEPTEDHDDGDLLPEPDDNGLDTPEGAS